MDPVILQEFVGQPVTVKLGAAEYRLTYPMQAVLLYKQKTAEIDRKRNAGRPRLKPAEAAELRAQARRLIIQSRDYTPKNDEPWDPAKQEEWNRLLDEASDIRAIVSADAGQGDSLFDVLTWRQIDPVKDPDRLVAALWAGIQPTKPDLTLDVVQKMIDLGNAKDVTFAIAFALTSYIRRSEVMDPNAQTPATMPA